jgi:hypothetical protein
MRAPPSPALPTLEDAMTENDQAVILQLEEENRQLNRIADALVVIAGVVSAIEPLVGPLVAMALEEIKKESER